MVSHNDAAGSPAPPQPVPALPAQLPSPQQAPTPQAHTTALRTDVLAELAAATGADLTTLGQLTVSESAHDLWNALRFYVSFAPVPPGHPPPPLAVETCSRARDDDPAAGSGSMKEHISLLRLMEAEAGGARALGAAAAGRGMQPPSRPVFSLAPARVPLVWPPPRHLATEQLIKLRDAHPGVSLQKAVMEQQLKQNACAENKADTDSPEKGNVSSNGEGGAKSDREANGDAGGDVLGNADCADAQQTTIHLVYYRIGNPLSLHDRPTFMHEILLACAAGLAPLMCFAEEVIAWHKQVRSAPDLQSRFPLYRYMDQHGCGHWQNEGLKRARPEESVVLPGALMQTILKDVTNFSSEATRTWYFRHGLPYRRAYLFYGPPGTGKTSTVRVIASKFMLSCCVLSVANNSFSNQSLNNALSSLPGHSLLVLEDVDALFNEDRSNKLENQLTFSGLLNALDGLVSVEGLITVMTTNHIERLEKALIRGGRVDRKFKFSLPADEQLRKLFLSFYPDCDAQLVESFVKKVRAHCSIEEARAVSTLQQLFIEMREESAEDCVGGIEEFFKQHFPDDGAARQVSYTI